MSKALRQMVMSQTTISISEDVADRLYDRKGRGESYNDVVLELLEAVEQLEADGSAEGVSPGDMDTGAPETMEPPHDGSDRSAGAQEPESELSLAETIDAVVDDVLPGSGAKLEDRRVGFHAVVEYLHERGEAAPKDFQTDVYPEHTGHYTDGDDPAQSWWKNCMYKGLAELAERTEIVEKADTSGQWSWQGDSA